MKAHFGDTYYYLALLNPSDAGHAKARRISQQLAGPIVTSAWVIQELADGLAAPSTRTHFVRFITAIEADPNTEIIPADQVLWRRGLELYCSRTDKGWSLTDCLSFIIMRDRGITDALTADHHFTQAGFNTLLTTGT